MVTTYRIHDLHQKVAFVVGHCEFLFVRTALISKDKQRREPTHKAIVNATKQNMIAEHLLISPPQWSRMKRGKEAIAEVQLGKLSQYFDIERSCDFLIWLKPYDVFTLTLTNLGFGRLRYRTNGPSLKELLFSRTRSGHHELRIVPVERNQLAMRGLGGPAAVSETPIELRPGDTVRVTVAGTETVHHLVLLSQEPEGQFTVLAPTDGHPIIISAQRDIVLPDPQNVYPVGRPFGPHLLYAILTKTSLGLESKLNFEMPFPILPQILEDVVRDELAGLDEDRSRILLLPYEVVR